MPITEAKVREVHNATDLSKYRHSTLVDADHWVKSYAIHKLEESLNAIVGPGPVNGFVLLMARCHYGSVETDEFLQKMGCYPEWMNKD